MDLQLSRLLANVPPISDLHLNFLSEKVLNHFYYSMMLMLLLAMCVFSSD
jgi:hypothetical protein